MIFRNNSGSIALVFNPLIPSFITRKSLGTPVALNKLNPIFRIKKIEKVDETLSLKSVSQNNNLYLDIVSSNIGVHSQISNDYSDVSQNTLSILNSQYINDYSDVSQNSLSTLSSQYTNDYLDLSQNSLSTFISQYANDYLDLSQNSLSTLSSQYANDYLDFSQNTLSTLSSQYTNDYLDFSQNTVGSLSSEYTSDYLDISQNTVGSLSSEYTSDYSDLSQNTLNILSSQYTNDYSDISQNSLSTLSSLFTNDYSDVSQNSLSTLSSQFANVQSDISQNSLSTLSSQFANEQSDVVSSSTQILLGQYAQYLDNDISSQNTKLSSLKYDFINLFTVSNELNLTSLNLNSAEVDKTLQTNVLTQLNYDLGEFSKKTEQQSNLINLTRNFFNTVVDTTNNLANLKYSPFINESVTLTQSIQSLTHNTANIDTVSSSIKFKPYSTASNVTFNDDSLVNYVKQINVIYYMSGSVLTQSIINYTQDLVFQVIGNANTGLYQTNFDYNTPYRASYITKNWPVYQRNTSSLWYLPVILNCSNSERKISATSGDWVEAALENGSSFTDQYGFSIDI